MDIIFQGKQTAEDAAESLVSVLNLFKERYGITNLREMHLSVTLVDEEGDDVELVDDETSKVFKVFEVYKEGDAANSVSMPPLKLVVDNTR